MLKELFENPKFDILLSLKRWNGFRLIKEESVGLHTFLVAIFSEAIYENLFREKQEAEVKVLVYKHSLKHDGDEIWDYDINHEVKYNDFNGNEIRKHLDSYKNFMFDKNPLLKILQSDETNILVKHIVKLSDWLSCVYYLGKEVELGNRTVLDKFKYSKIMLEKKCDEVRLFLEEHYPRSYHETIGEIKNINFYSHE